jgi:redox-sensitive bicupin YhaK (pirin superfamily)
MSSRDTLVVRAGGHQEKVEGGHAVALHGGRHGGFVTFEALPRSHFLVISGAEIREPVVGQGPFIMNDPLQIEEAGIRYRMGAMGHLAPLSDS